MIDLRDIQAVEPSFEIEQVQVQNQTLRNNNGGLMILLVLSIAIGFAVAHYYRDQEREKNRVV